MYFVNDILMPSAAAATTAIINIIINNVHVKVAGIEVLKKEKTWTLCLAC